VIDNTKNSTLLSSDEGAPRLGETRQGEEGNAYRQGVNHMEQKEGRVQQTRSANWDKLELFARPLRYIFLVTTAGIFIATNLKAFQNNQVGMWLFFASGILWMLSVAYIEIREFERFSHRLRSESLGQGSFSHHRQRRNKMVRWFRTHATITGVLVVLGAAIALYVIPLYPSKPWWGVILIALGPLAMWLTSRVERKSHDNANLIRQLQPLAQDAGGLEFTIRGFAHDLLNNPEVKTELGGELGIQGWSSYIKNLGDWQISTLNSLKTDLKEADPFEQPEIISVLTSFNQILGRLLEVELRLVAVCQRINNIPAEAEVRWEYIQQVHQRLGTQLSNLKPILREMEREDLFDTFTNQPPQNLRQIT